MSFLFALHCRAMPRPRTGGIRWDRGAWRVRVYTGKDATGKRTSASRTVREPNNLAGKRAATRVLLTLLDDIDAEKTVDTTLAQLLDQWITFRTPDWDDAAVANARGRLAKNVIPFIGDMKIRDLTGRHLAMLYSELRDGADDREPLSAATVKRMHSLVRAALQQAVKWGDIPHNPADSLTPPKVPRPQPRNLPTPAQIQPLLADTEAPSWMPTFLRLALHTGARRGELIALKWSDVDFDTAVIRIHQTKTDKPKTVPIGPQTMAGVRAWRQGQLEMAMRWGFGTPVWVFPNWVTGSHVTAPQVTHAWARLRARHDMDHVRLHDLRHTMATRLITSGVDVRTVADRGGWSSPSVLLGTYTHGVDEPARQAAAELDAWLDG